MAGSAIGPAPLRLELHSLSRQPMPFPIAPDTLVCAVPNRNRHCSQATTFVVKFTRRCPDEPWSCCVKIVAFKFSALPFQRHPRTFLQLTDHESLFKWHAVQRSRFLDHIIRETSVIGALPTQIPWPNLGSRLPVGTAVYLYITLSPNGNTLLVYAFPKTRTNANPPSFST